MIICNHDIRVMSKCGLISQSLLINKCVSNPLNADKRYFFKVGRVEFDFGSLSYYYGPLTVFMLTLRIPNVHCYYYDVVITRTVIPYLPNEDEV